jgi:hypothetical protein
MEIEQNLQTILVSAFEKGFCTFVGIFFDPLLSLRISIHINSALIRIGLAPWIRILIEKKGSALKTNADPQH